MESGDRETATMSASRDVPIRDSAPLSSSHTFGRSLEPSWTSSVPDVSRPSGADVWSGAISRLQTQVSLSTSMLESHQRQIAKVETDVRNLNDELRNIVSVLHEIRADVRTKNIPPAPTRNPSEDFDVLAKAVTSKANEVDGIKLQLELMKSRMKRFEEQSGPAAALARPDTSASSAHQDAALHGTPPLSQHAAYAHPHPHQGPPHQALPPMRTASMASPMEARQVGPFPILEPRGRPGYAAPADIPRHYSGDSASSVQPSPGNPFRPSDPLPPPSSLPGWRSSDSLPQSGGLPPPTAALGHSRPQTMEPELQGSGWASINANQTTKRPFEEPRASPYQSPRSGSPKRPKLAPIMPRSSYGDESYVPSSIAQSGTTEASLHERSRATSDVSLSQSQMASTPMSSNAPSYRFITSTTQGDSQESWRPEHERGMHGPHHGHGHGHGHGGHGHGHGPGHGRRGGRRGGRGGRRGRGGGGVLLDVQREELPEWERSEWSSGQPSPNGVHHSLQPLSPRGGRGGWGRRGGGFGFGPSELEASIPQTPSQDAEDASALDVVDGGPGGNSGGKKTRTKPIRNAEGILIRKDGRPDMRSVSSANNLRKVHAKKEAERAEGDGKTPTSARIPVQGNSDDENGSRSEGHGTSAEAEGAEDSRGDAGQENRNLMGRIYAMGPDAPRNVAERFFPKHDKPDIPEADMKSEGGEAREESQRGDDASQMTDVVMSEMSDAQAADHREREQDSKMSTVEEANEEHSSKGPGQSHAVE